MPENRTFFCNTTATLSLKETRSYSLTSRPATFTEPSLTSYRREIRFTKLVLPEPVEPKIPINCPDFICKLSFSKVFLFAVSTYLKLTFSKSTEPSLISIIGLSGFLMVGSSFNTSEIRLIDSTDMTNITIIMDMIMTDDKI